MTRKTVTPAIGIELGWLEALLKRAAEHAEHLTDQEIRFVDRLTVQADKWGAATFVSDKQRAWLKSIERRLDEAGVAKEED